MLRKTKMAVAVVLVLGVSSAALAGGSRNDADASGGFAVGPMGQVFQSGVNPVFHPELFGKSDFAGVPHQQGRPHNKAINR
jgi:hypothetical protein